jgi:hypothetical protein
MKKMKFAKTLFLFAFLFYGAVSLVSAEVAMSIPFLKDNTFEMDDDVTVFSFTLLNTGGAQTTAKVRFMVPNETGVELNGESLVEQTHTLAPYEKKTIDISINANGRMIFPLLYSYAQVQSLSGGVSFDVWTQGSFNVNVENCVSDCYEWEEADEPVKTTAKKAATVSSNNPLPWLPGFIQNSSVQSVESVEQDKEEPVQSSGEVVFGETAGEIGQDVDVSGVEAIQSAELGAGLSSGEDVRDEGALTLVFTSLFLIGSLGGFMIANFKKDEIKSYLKGGKL